MCNMGKCRTCNETIQAPVYREEEEWFCSLKCWKLMGEASDMPNREDVPRSGSGG